MTIIRLESLQMEDDDVQRAKQVFLTKGVV